jgi:hypothetical protein
VNCDATDGLGITSTDLDQILPDWKDRHKTTRSGYSEVDDIFITYFDLIEKMKKTFEPFEKNNIIKLIDIVKISPVIKRYFRTNYKRNHPYIIKKEDL